MPDISNIENVAGVGKLAAVEKIDLKSRWSLGLSGRLSLKHLQIPALKPLPAHIARIIQRCFIISTALWFAMQGAYYYEAVQLPGAYWFVFFLGAALFAFIFADRLSGNFPRASVSMQIGAIALIGVSLVQGGSMVRLPEHLAWAMPALALIPTLYVALRRNLESFALIAYGLALLVPLLAGLHFNRPLLFFGYYLLLCLPLPILTALRGWRYLNIGVFGWVFAAAAYYLGSIYFSLGIAHAQVLFVMFFACYFFTVLATVRKESFNILNVLDFLFTVGLAAGAIICQIRITQLQGGGVLLPALMLALTFTVAGALLWLATWEKGATLGRIYLLFALLLFNGSFTAIWPGSVALGIYCAEAVILFGLGSSRDMPRVKAGGFIILMLTPLYFFLTQQHMLTGSVFIGASLIWCAYLQDRELKRLALRSGRRPWSSSLEFFLVALGFAWCFGGLAVYVFRSMPEPGLIYFATCSASAYFFYAFGKLVRLRSLRTAIFIPMLVSIPAVLLPFLYQLGLEWPMLSHLVSYNYLTGLGALAWISYFVTVWTALYHSWGGLISNRLHAWFLAIVTLELVLVLTSSGRAFALESGVSPSVLSVLGVLPSLGCVFVLSRVIKFKQVDAPYRTPLFLAVPWVLFTALALWFLSALASPGSAAPGGKYVPLLNPVEMVQLISIMIFGYWQRRLRKSVQPIAHLSWGAVLWVYAGASLLWIHGVMLRVVQYFSQADVYEVLGFVELRLIFACIWVVYGILVWIGSTMFASSISWFISSIMLAAGASTLIYLALGLWGQFVAIVMCVTALVILALLLWRSPIPFTRRGKKSAESVY